MIAYPIDITCRVIDHLGDVGVAWRLAMALKGQFPNQSIRLLIDDPTILSWLIAPSEQELVEVVWFDDISTQTFVFAPIIIESLGCRIPERLLDLAYNSGHLIIHLEALSAEPWVKNIHGNESLLGTTARRFMLCPGFEAGTLGMLPPIPMDMSRNEFIVAHNLKLRADTLWIATYTYNVDISPWLEAADRLGRKVDIIVLGKKIQYKTEIPLCPPLKKGEEYSNLHFVKNLSQRSFDTLLSLCDLNIVRGEDSFSTSLQLGVPTLWQAYPQDDETRHIKVEAFLTWVNESTQNIPPCWHTIMRDINGISPLPSEVIILAFLESLGTMRLGFNQLGQKIQALGPFAKNLMSSILII